jgi:3,4-dihydroxy 2-butanone 4-phosphate synthase/GTP cyclohydrolase II
VTIEAREGVTTGISAADRAHTMQVAVDPTKGPDDIVKGGPRQPAQGEAGGVLERVGHTEASVDLARLAGLIPAGVICEVMRDDGTMARVPDLEDYSERHGLKMVTIADLVAYRRRHDKLVERVVATSLPTVYGDFDAVGYRALVDGKHHVALVKGDVAASGRARARALRVPDRRRLPLAALRLRRAARVGAVDDRARGRGRACSTSPRRAAASACSTSSRPTSCRRRATTPSTPTSARPARRPARLRHRRADPRRPRADVDPHPHEQPQEDPRPGGLRPVGHRPGADPAHAQPAQRGYLRPKKEKLGHMLHHQGLALDEEMVHAEQVADKRDEERE